MRIFLVRHGESLGNVDEKAYARLQDHNVPLTPQGHAQAAAAGAFLRDYYQSNDDLKNRKLRIWYSPFKRTVETKDGIVAALGGDMIRSVYEDFLLREQDFGIFSHMTDDRERARKFPDQFKRYAALQQAQGKFYTRAPDGESRSDVAQRARIFLGSIMRDVARGEEDVVIVGHGVTNRAIEMGFMHRSVEWFENAPNPGNCDIVLIEGTRETGYTASKIYTGLPGTPVAQPQKKSLIRRVFGR